MTDRNPDKGYVALLGWSLNAIDAVDRFDRRYVVVAPEWAEAYARENDIPYIPWDFDRLDEPTAALDYHNQESILKLMRALSGRRGLAIVFTTHNPEHAALVADQTLAMRKHAPARLGPTEEVLTESCLRDVYGMDVRPVAFTLDGQPARSVLPIYRLDGESPI